MDTFQVGDHLFVECGGYSHHGIYIGDGNLIHFDSTPARKFVGSLNGAPPKIVEVSLDEFSQGKEVHVREYLESEDSTPWSDSGLPHDGALDPDEVVQRAQSRLGEKGYDLFENNCEHFAVWCKTGTNQSSQVESACRVASTGAASVVVGSAIIRSARLLPGPYKILAYGAGAAIAVGSTTYRYVLERQKNRATRQS